MPAPIALTCGEPGGVGPELAVAARIALPDLPFFWIGDPRHLPEGSAWQEIGAPDEAASVRASHLPVLRRGQVEVDPIDLAALAPPLAPFPPSAARAPTRSMRRTHPKCWAR